MILTLEQLLRTDLRGKTVVFETDTVYGLGCLLADQEAVKRIYEIKNREAAKPMAILAANSAQVAPLVVDFTPAEAITRLYWPGALTIVLPKSHLVPDYVTSGLATVGIRIPASPVARAILERFGPMVVTSLNLSHEPAIVNWADAARYDGIADYLVLGPDLHGVASTVYDPIAKRTLRQGSVVIAD